MGEPLTRGQANVMMEYSFDEAIALLETNLATASKSLSEVNENLAFLRDQATTTEVSECAACASVCNPPPPDMARIYNHDIKSRRQPTN